MAIILTIIQIILSWYCVSRKHDYREIETGMQLLSLRFETQCLELQFSVEPNVLCGEKSTLPREPLQV